MGEDETGMLSGGTMYAGLHLADYEHEWRAELAADTTSTVEPDGDLHLWPTFESAVSGGADLEPPSPSSSRRRRKSAAAAVGVGVSVGGGA